MDIGGLTDALQQNDTTIGGREGSPHKPTGTRVGEVPIKVQVIPKDKPTAWPEGAAARQNNNHAQTLTPALI